MNEPAEQSEVVRGFLAMRDMACPGCGYNLRGSAGEACPECGRAIELALAGGPARRTWVALLMLFVAVLALSGMDATRAGIDVHREAQTWQAFQVLVTGPGGITQRRVNSGATSTLTAGRITFTQTNMVVGTSRFNFTPAPRAMTWSNVSWQTWTRAGWWGILALAALVALAMVLARRRRWGTDAAPRGLVRGAVIMSALLVAGHVLMFTREMIG